MFTDFHPILAIAYRDFIKYLKDKPRVIVSFVFPIVFIGILGGSLQAGLGDVAGYSLIMFTFTGILAQTVFQTVTQGVISLTADQESNFTQEIFVAPISRYSIIFGKILGESAVAVFQGLFVILFGFLIGVRLAWTQLLVLMPVLLVIALLGGAFGILLAASIGSQQNANRIISILIFPQFFLAGIFAPIQDLPVYLLIPSRLVPLTYAVDLLRSVFYFGQPEASQTVLYNPALNLLVIAAYFVIFLIIGTYLFVNSETKR